jgi:hypothetical protein
MAKSTSHSTIRKDISRSLLDLAQVLQLNTNGVVRNPETLISSANTAIIDRKDGVWLYSVDRLSLEVDLPQNTLPIACLSPLNIELSIEVKGHCDRLEDGELEHLILNLMISSGDSNYCAWHFDRHTEEGNTVDAHPLYHFQHGGHAMKTHSDHLGKTLILPAPRLAFPPMDAILAIDFVLSNFCGECWQSLRDDPTYVRLLKSSQRSLWKPYLTRLASWWDTGPKNDGALRLFPHLA